MVSDPTIASYVTRDYIPQQRMGYTWKFIQLSQASMFVKSVANRVKNDHAWWGIKQEAVIGQT